MLCPHCGASLEANAQMCLNCGADLPTVWPPPLSQPSGPFIRLPEPSGATLLGFLLGFGVEGAWWVTGAQVVYGLSYSRPVRPLILVDILLFGFPAIGVGLAAFLLRRNRPQLARGMNYSAVMMLAGMLGAFAICH